MKIEDLQNEDPHWRCSNIPKKNSFVATPQSTIVRDSPFIVGVVLVCYSITRAWPSKILYPLLHHRKEDGLREIMLLRRSTTKSQFTHTQNWIWCTLLHWSSIRSYTYVFIVWWWVNKNSNLRFSTLLFFPVSANSGCATE